MFTFIFINFFIYSLICDYKESGYEICVLKLSVFSYLVGVSEALHYQQ